MPIRGIKDTKPPLQLKCHHRPVGNHQIGLAWQGPVV